MFDTVYHTPYFICITACAHGSIPDTEVLARASMTSIHTTLNGMGWSCDPHAGGTPTKDRKAFTGRSKETFQGHPEGLHQELRH